MATRGGRQSMSELKLRRLLEHNQSAKICCFPCEDSWANAIEQGCEKTLLDRGSKSAKLVLGKKRNLLGGGKQTNVFFSVSYSIAKQQKTIWYLGPVSKLLD